MVRAQRTYESHVRIQKQIKFSRSFGADPTEDSVKQTKKDSKPQLSSMLKPAPHFGRGLPLPYELLLKIFHEVVETSDHPIEDLFSLTQVCETWRVIIIQTPTLWSRINLNKIPLTDGNLRVLRDIFAQPTKTDLKPDMPGYLDNVRELCLKGSFNITRTDSLNFLDSLVTAPNLQDLHINKLEQESSSKMNGRLTRSIGECKNLRRLSIKHTRTLFTSQKWLADFLTDKGRYLEELNLTSSMATIHTQLFRAIGSDYCPALRVLDLSTCDTIQTHSFDAVRLVETMPNLVVLRAANVSFRRVPMPLYHGLCKLQELSMPIAIRDTDRDDALLATLAYGSEEVSTLDIRGSSITAHALLSMPSYDLRALHIDDICPITRTFYGRVIKKWQHSLEILSLVKINCAATIRQCLEALINVKGEPKIKEIDLQSSEVDPDDLRKFLSKATRLQKIDLSACRSLPRGCKGIYSGVQSQDTASIYYLKQRLGVDPDSETEIDEVYLREQSPCLSRKRRRVTKKLTDYVYDDE